MPSKGEYLGMPVEIGDLDEPNRSFYRFCALGELRLQQCSSCGLKRYPPTTACPFCAHPDSTWVAVEGRGTLYSYGEVHHAIQPAFRAHVPYLLLLVELDEQRDTPSPFDGLRLTGNLAAPDGSLATPDMVRQVGVCPCWRSTGHALVDARPRRRTTSQTLALFDRVSHFDLTKRPVCGNLRDFSPGRAWMRVLTTLQTDTFEATL